jgi:hypothetical protein
MFQDTAGTTPVTTPGQTVARINDKSGRGNNATQATTASRPTYGIVSLGGRRNLLLATDTMATQSLTVAAVAHTLAFTGTGTVTLTGASIAGPLIGTGASNRVSLTFTPTAASLTLTVIGSVTLAQLELGSTATAYQRVTTQYDVTEAGVQSLSYLSFDGVDDFLVTPTITPGVDKAQVFAGYRIFNSTSTLIAETSTNSFSSTGALSIAQGAVTGGTGVSSLMTTVGAEGAAKTIPYTGVTTTIFDKSLVGVASEIAIRLNGSSIALPNITGTDSGTGNFLAYPIYIGRRAGTSLPFNGQFYSLVVRFGANLDAATIGNTETYVAGKTGVTI